MFASENEMSGTSAANMCKALGELVSDELKALNSAKWGLMWPVQFSAGIDISRMVFYIVMITNSSLC